jgi:hypothetical protein
VDQQTVRNFNSRLPDTIQGYSLENIFNADETGLYYKALPDKTLAMRGDGAKGFKVHKDRITVLFACSAMGEKLTPLVIGKAANPRCLKNVRRERLGVTYVSNKRAWMTSAVFSDWLRDVNSEMRRKGRKILLFMESAAFHTADMSLSHVQLSFLPANTTSQLQPLDQGVIRAFKAVNRRFMLRALLATVKETDDAASVCRSVTNLDAIKWTVKAWHAIQASTIQKCFIACGFTAETTETSDDEYPDDDIHLVDLVLHFRFQLDELTSLDTGVGTHYSVWEADIFNCYREDATNATDPADSH